MRTKLRSRRLYTIVMALLGITLPGCEGVPAPLVPEGAQFSRGGGEINQQFSALRHATARFLDFPRAAEAGYTTRITPCWYHRALGAQGEHHGNPGLIDGAVALLEPELLMYEPQANGRLRLVGLEYIVPVDAWQGESPPRLLGQEFHHNTNLGLYVLHVWLWRHNPAGMFEDWNPDVSCEHAADAEDRAP